MKLFIDSNDIVFILEVFGKANGDNFCLYFETIDDYDFTFIDPQSLSSSSLGIEIKYKSDTNKPMYYASSLSI